MKRRAMNNQNKGRMTPMRISLILASAISCVAIVVYVATFDHAPRSAAYFCALAAAWTVAAAIAPLWLESLIINGATFQLAVITWRLMTMLGAFVVVQTFPGDAKKCFLTTLMACYFIALPLESLLLARNASKQ